MWNNTRLSNRHLTQTVLPSVKQLLFQCCYCCPKEGTTAAVNLSIEYIGFRSGFPMERQMLGTSFTEGGEQTHLHNAMDMIFFKLHVSNIRDQVESWNGFSMNKLIVIMFNAHWFNSSNLHQAWCYLTTFYLIHYVHQSIANRACSQWKFHLCKMLHQIKIRSNLFRQCHTTEVWII